MKKIALLGSTGSIGKSTMDIVARHPDQFRVTALAAGRNLEILSQQIKLFKPSLVSVHQQEDAQKLRQQFPAMPAEIVYGDEGVVAVACHPDADLVISAIVGAAGLRPTLAALKEGKNVALANKESLVIAGKIMTDEVRRHDKVILPIDSEHNAIFQVLRGNERDALKRILLTASGGPFCKRSLDELRGISVEEALKHPNWDMGAKITIDSATMMNKGLEVIEATWLFGVGADQIDVHIHPQSIVHSMVEFIDGSILAQLGVPDMRCAISYAMAYPQRIESGVESLNLFEVESLNFYKPDLKKFRCLYLAMEAVRVGASMPAVLNAANEIAVAAFLEKKIGFLDIAVVVEEAMLAHPIKDLTTLDDVLEVDGWARRQAQDIIRKRGHS